MKRLLLINALGVALVAPLTCSPAFAAPGYEPGFYGRIDLVEGLPPPLVINATPVLIAPPPPPVVPPPPLLGPPPPPGVVPPPPGAVPPPVAAVPRNPIYLHVPQGYELDWGRYCSVYNACNQPVYFVREDWYRNVYARHYRQYGDPRRGEYYDERRGPHDPYDRDWDRRR